MKKLSLAILMASLLAVPTPSYAHHWGRYRHYEGAAIAAGVLGGLATGIILDRILFPPPPPRVYYPESVYYPPPVYSPPPPRRDPYDRGYSEGYSEGVSRGRYERYEQGRSRGYQDGYDDASGGRANYR